MSVTQFWLFRFTMLGGSIGMAIATMAVILWNGLHHNLLMKYAFALASSQLVMALLGLLFGFGSVVFDLESIVDPFTHQLISGYSSLQALFNIEAILFKSSEMACFFLTTMMTYAIYKALKHQARIPRERQLITMGLSLCFALMVGLSLAGGFSLCDVDEIYFNYVCTNPSQILTYTLLWALPCTILAFLTLVLMLLIRRRYTSTFATMRTEFKLVLIVYYIPCLSFLIYLFDVALTMHVINTEPYTQSVLFHIVFLMPAITLVTVCKYRNEFCKTRASYDQTIATRASSGILEIGLIDVHDVKQKEVL